MGLSLLFKEKDSYRKLAVSGGLSTLSNPAEVIGVRVKTLETSAVNFEKMVGRVGFEPHSA